MKTYIAYIKTALKLVMRDRAVLFFNYFMPLTFFIVFAQSFSAAKGGSISQVITMVLILGVLGSGFFGAGIRAVQDREMNVLRRFKVAPITPLPILVSSLITGLISYLPSVVMILAIAHFYYGMPWPERWLSLFALLSLGVVAFRSMGLIVASVVNSMQESQILIQMLYLPMLFLSGATFPISIMPTWLQITAQFLPASYLFTGLQGILVQKDSLLNNLGAMGAMLVTLVVATFIGVKLFRWEKDEKMPASSKLWVLAVLLPFLLMGTYQAYSRENVSKAKTLYREMRRNRSVLIRGPRVITGDGKVIPSGGVLIQNGKIAEIYESVPAENSRADVMEASGKTLLPTLNDAHVHLLAPGGAMEPNKDVKPERVIARALAAYLFSGVTAVKSVGDPQSFLLQAKLAMSRGDKLGAELFHTGKMFTTEGGHGTEYFKSVPEAMREVAARETLFLPKTQDEARRQVDEVKQSGANGVKVILDGGQAGMLFNRMDSSILKAICEQARKNGLPVAVHTGDARDVADAVAAGAAVIEHGSARDAIPDPVFATMAKQGIAYDPTLSVIEAINQLRGGQSALLDRTLVQQAAPEGLIAATRKAIPVPGSRTGVTAEMDIAAGNLRRAWRAGVTLVTGTDSGNFLLVHGPAVHRELQLWVKAGIPAGAALQAATGNSAKLIGLGNRSGLIRTGYEASLLLVDGNPLEDIAATERISMVMFKGERVSLASLFDKE
ncbi:MAG TPA: ABC transporter permease [Bryobacteraceae bacterium]|nr:ABC transporter permease [Bryobacteraceae bacterium]